MRCFESKAPNDFKHLNTFIWVNPSEVVLVIKNLPANAGDVRETDSIPGMGRSPGEGNGNPLQYSSLENPMDRGAWQATVHRVEQSQTWLKQLSMPPEHAGGNHLQKKSITPSWWYTRPHRKIKTKNSWKKCIIKVCFKCITRITRKQTFPGTK